SAPEPFAPQFFGLIPLPMNRAANRWGCAAWDERATDSLPSTGMDSSQGRPIVTPTPVRNVRLLILCGSEFIVSLPSMTPILPSTRVIPPSFIQKLRTRDNRFDQAPEGVLVGLQPRPHLFDRLLVREQQAAS